MKAGPSQIGFGIMFALGLSYLMWFAIVKATIWLMNNPQMAFYGLGVACALMLAFHALTGRRV